MLLLFFNWIFNHNPIIIYCKKHCNDDMDEVEKPMARLTETQKKFKEQMNGQKKSTIKEVGPFKDSKIFYYGRLILMIAALLWLGSLFDSTVYSMLDMFR